MFHFVVAVDFSLKLTFSRAKTVLSRFSSVFAASVISSLYYILNKKLLYVTATHQVHNKTPSSPLIFIFHRVRQQDFQNNNNKRNKRKVRKEEASLADEHV